MADLVVKCDKLKLPFTTGGIMQQPAEWVRLTTLLREYKGGEFAEQVMAEML